MFRSLSAEYLVFFTVGLCLLLCVILHKLNKWWCCYCIRRRFNKGNIAEKKAVKILIKSGYKIVATQQSLPARMYVDGVEQKYFIRPDVVVKKKGKLFLVEVKYGDVATNPLYKDTRRQLLEYDLFSNTYGLLLVDMNSEKVHNISFFSKMQKRNRCGVFMAFFLGVACTVFCIFLIGF